MMNNINKKNIFIIESSILPLTITLTLITNTSLYEFNIMIKPKINKFKIHTEYIILSNCGIFSYRKKQFPAIVVMNYSNYCREVLQSFFLLSFPV